MDRFLERIGPFCIVTAFTAVKAGSRARSPIRTALAALALLTAAHAAPAAEPRHAIAMHGQPAMPPTFQAMPYVKPDAPKGGRLVQGVLVYQVADR